jgi:IS5 family transposase
VDRGKRGLKRSVASDGDGIPLAWVVAPANTHDSPLLAPTLATLGGLGPLPTQPTVHLDRGYDSGTTRTTLAERGLDGCIAHKGTPAPIQASKRWPVERTHAWATRSPSSAGAPSGAGGWSSSTWRWPTQSSSCVG